jgi:hypothetical protein
MILGIPVVDGHELTKTLLSSLDATVTGESFKAVIIDNNSDVPYKHEDYDHYNFPVNIIHLDTNIGYYQPLKDLSGIYDDELIGLIHNDMVLYERGWNERMEQCFTNDKKLSLVGLCGSSEIDALGGRGGGTVCFFRGGVVQVGETAYTGQDQAAGGRITELVPSACLDSLFMMFRREAISDLVTEADPWGDITLAHFYDRIWPVRLVEAGWHVGTLGVECDHLGGMTTTGNMRYRNDCIKWLEERDLLGKRHEDPETSMYLIAEDRYLGEYRDNKHFIPCRVHGDYTYERIAN